MKLFTVILASLFPTVVMANACPWQTGKDIIGKEVANKSVALTKEQVASDLDCLETLIENIYIAPRFNDFDFGPRIEGLKKSSKATNSQQLMKEMFNLHAGLVDLHLSYSVAKHQLKFKSADVEYGLPMYFRKAGGAFERIDDKNSSDLVSCKELLPVDIGGGIFVFKLKPGLSPKATINCLLKNKKTVTISESGPLPNVYVHESDEYEADVIHQLADGLIYLKPGSLINFLPEQQKVIDFLATYDGKVIVDLSNNPGGGGDYAEKMAQAIFTPDEAIPSYKRFQLYSKLQEIGFAKTLEMLKHEEAPTYMNQIKEYVDLDLQTLLTTADSDWVTFDMTGERSKPFAGQIIMITSSDCMSACESFVELLGTHPKVKRIGRNTGGVIHYSNAATFVLPNSGIEVSLPSLYSLAGYDAEEGIGYPVNVKKEFIDLRNAAELFEE